MQLRRRPHLNIPEGREHKAAFCLETQFTDWHRPFVSSETKSTPSSTRLPTTQILFASVVAEPLEKGQCNHFRCKSHPNFATRRFTSEIEFWCGINWSWNEWNLSELQTNLLIAPPSKRIKQSGQILFCPYLVIGLHFPDQIPARWEDSLISR